MNTSSAFIRPVAVALAVFLAGAHIQVQAAEAESAIATDRPDFVESSVVVGRGVFQLETSLAYERDRRGGGDVKSWTTPTLLRFGITDTLELRLETDAFTSQRSITNGQGANVAGFADVSLGVKWHIGDEAESGRPSTALLFHVDIDSGSAEFRRNGLAPSVRGVAEWSLSGGFSLGAMAGVVWDRAENSENFQSGILAVTVGKTFTDHLRGFVELAGRSLAKQQYGGNTVTFDAGLAYALDRDTQWDVAIAVSTNRETPDHALTVGFSKRFR